MTDDKRILGPEEFRLGLQIYLMCPSAPAASLALVTLANGHRGLSILISMLCTVIAVFTIPPMLAWLLTDVQDLNISVGEVLLNTVLRVLLPLIVGRCFRCVPPVRKFVKRFGTATKLFGLSFLIGVFLVKVSETSASGNLAKVSVVNILCVVGLGTSFTTLNVLSSYGVLSVLPWFSDKSTVTISIQCCIRVVGLAATIIDVLPDDSGDKGLLVLPMVFVYPATLLVLNCFVYCTKVNEEGTSEDKDSLSSDHVQQHDKDTENLEGSSADKDSLSSGHVKKHDKDTENYLRVESKINEVAVFTIYTGGMSVKDNGNL